MEFAESKPLLVELEKVSNIQVSVSERLGFSDIINKQNAFIVGGIIGLINEIQAQDFNYLVTFAAAISFGIGIALSLKMPNLDQSSVPGENSYVPQVVIS